MEFMNTGSLETIENAKLEAIIAEEVIGNSFQLERIGYFCLDSESTSENLVLNQRLKISHELGIWLF